MSIGSPNNSDISILHVNAKERHGRRYRNERSVFTLSDSDSDYENSINIKAASEEPKVSSHMKNKSK